MIDALLLCAAGLIVTAFTGFAARNSRGATTLVYSASAAITAFAAAAALSQLIAGAPDDARVLPLGLPWIGMRFRLDALSDFFLIVLNVGAAAASFFALGYGRHESEPARVLPFYPLFLAAINLVTVADDAFTFLLSWESMSLASWALVLAHHREDGNMRAGFIYLVMASFGTLALLLAFGLLAGPEGAYAFSSMRGVDHATTMVAIVFVLVLLGAGSKAGLVPLHVWLPLAHPAAPSHVSALMSGVMTKVAVYAFIRIVFDLLGPPVWWVGMTTLVLGAITAVMGVLYALMQHDLKRLLAYSTVENVGIIFIGIGLALAFKSAGMNVAAALALTAALFHVLNHMAFKSLLFLGAGAVLTATGERDMDALGGLIHRMPFTSFFFLIGCVAISALPPLNGFVSEWLTFQAILLSPSLHEWALRISVPAAGALLALSAALAAACFVKAFGGTFLGRVRSVAASEAREVDRFQLIAMAALAVLCLAAGTLSGYVIDWLAPVTSALAGETLPAQRANNWLTVVPIFEGRSSYNGLLVFAFIVVSACIAAIAIHRLACRALRRSDPWDCGFPDASPTTQYTTASFAQPIRRVYGTLVFRARESVDMPQPGEQRAAHFSVSLRDPVWEIIYRPVESMILHVSTYLNRLQFLTIRRYLMLVFAALVGLLVLLALWT